MKQMKQHLATLGRKAKDRVTGYHGVVSSVSFDLYGCVQAAVTPPVKSDGTRDNGEWFDILRLEISDELPVMEPPNFEKGLAAEGKTGAAEKPAQTK